MANYTKAFTLVELLVAMTIIMVLTIVAVVNYGSVQKNARDSKRKADLEKVRVALEMYRQDHDGCYPANANSLDDDGYLDVVPVHGPKGEEDLYCFDFSTACGTGSGTSTYTLRAGMEMEKNNNMTDANCTIDEVTMTVNYQVTNP